MKTNHIKYSKGFTLFELMICVAVIGIVAAVAVPGYRSYIDTANMSKVTSNFEEAVRVARNTMAKDATRVNLGMVAQSPTTTDGWIQLFNRTDVQAPGGGPAYIPSNNAILRGRGDEVTGAVGVRWQPERRSRPGTLVLWRPLYLGLSEQRAIITHESIDIIVQRPAS